MIHIRGPMRITQDDGSYIKRDIQKATHKVTKISTDHELIQLIKTQTKASKRNIDAAALLFSKIITQGLKESTTPAPPQKKYEGKTSTPRRPTDTKVNSLMQEKSALLNKMPKASKNRIKTLWKEVQTIQKQIRKHTSQTWINTNRQWWDELNTLDPTADSADFWNLCKKFKYKISSQFPTVIQDEEGNTYHTKETIMKHAQGYYEAISTNTDTPAKNFYESLGMTHDEVKA